MTTPTRRLALVGTALAIALTGCFGGRDEPTDGPNGPTATQPTGSGGADSVLDPQRTRAAIAALGGKPGKDLKPNRLARGLVPPTNRWFSGLVFGGQPNPVFPLPLTFGLDGDAFAFGLPEVTTSEKTIMGSHRPSVKVDLQGANGWGVIGYDEMTVTMAPRGGSGELRIAQGSPFVWFSTPDGATLSTNVAFVQTGDHWEARDGSATYGLVLDKGKVEGSRVTLEKNGRATWFALPEGGKADELARLAEPLGTTSASWDVAGDQATTTLHYAEHDTAFAALPHQQASLVDTTCDLGTYASIMGELKLCKGKELTFRTPVHPRVATLDVSKLDDADKEALKKQIPLDIATAKPYAADTYFGGKALYRDAQLYSLAKQLGAPEAAQLKAKLTEAMARWTDPTGCQTRPEYCFFYDETNKGIVGQVASFGADEFNDHHFHWGYFLYAGAVLAQDDPSLVEKYRPVLDLLAADIASSTPSEEFPVRRNFDAWNGHAWASGTSPFGDGNNQESSSESVHSWAGLGLWAEASKNDALATEAAWMQSLESATAKAYYVEFDRSEPVYRGYGHTISPLIFGGKRDYATWFSPEPAAMLGIQVLPLSPSLTTYLKGDAGRIRDNVKEGVGARGFQQQYGDYLLMYSALAGDAERKDALEQATKFPIADIDDGITKTYLMAYLMTLPV